MIGAAILTVLWLFSSIESLLHWPRGTEAAGEDSCVTRTHCWTFK